MCCNITLPGVRIGREGGDKNYVWAGSTTNAPRTRNKKTPSWASTPARRGRLSLVMCSARMERQKLHEEQKEPEGRLAIQTGLKAASLQGLHYFRRATSQETKEKVKVRVEAPQHSRTPTFLPRKHSTRHSRSLPRRGAKTFWSTSSAEHTRTTQFLPPHCTSSCPTRPKCRLEPQSSKACGKRSWISSPST